MNYQRNFKIILLKTTYIIALSTTPLRTIAKEHSKCLYWDAFLFMIITSSVSRFNKNMSSFLIGYNWVNQVCNRDHAREVTFKDKFHLIGTTSLMVRNKDWTSHVGTWPPQASRKLDHGSCSHSPSHCGKSFLLTQKHWQTWGFSKKKVPYHYRL